MVNVRRPTGPNLEEPDEVFLDGAHIYQVAVWPAAFPVRFTQDNRSGSFGDILFELLYVSLVGVAAKALDSRYKVVVSRKLTRRTHLWKVVQVEFLANADDAERRQLDLLKSWRRQDYADVPPLSAAELHRKRSTSRGEAT